MSDKLLEHIKLEEGFRGEPYTDTEGYPTIGYGTKLPLTKKESELLLKYRLNLVVGQIKSTFYDLKAPEEVWDILFHMGYQLGLNGLLKFKKMIKALYAYDYKTAGLEMRDSLWYNQTRNRAERLAKQMEGIK